MSGSLSETKIRRRLQEAYQPGAIASMDGPAEAYEGKPLRCAAVLMPMAWQGKDWHLVFTRRTESVEHHKGQVSFPGGACDKGETSPEETALREAQEEIGLRPEDVRILGRLNDILTITQYRVTPVVGVMPWPYALCPAPNEVKRVFTIPIGWLADPGNRETSPFTPSGAARPFPVVRYREYDGEILWGASARIVLNYLAVLGLGK